MYNDQDELRLTRWVVLDRQRFVMCSNCQSSARNSKCRGLIKLRCTRNFHKEGNEFRLHMLDRCFQLCGTLNLYKWILPRLKGEGSWLEEELLLRFMSLLQSVVKARHIENLRHAGPRLLTDIVRNN